jgi:2-polyprenyl-6-methoxyphenol hydroxylase-like FAD-dependent oxidoreductase
MPPGLPTGFPLLVLRPYDDYWFIPVFEGGFSLFYGTGRAGTIHLILGDPESNYLETHFPEITRLIPDLRERFNGAADGVLGSVTCEQWHTGNHTVILGDAAHGILPFMGQGLNTGLEICSS